MPKIDLSNVRIGRRGDAIAIKRPAITWRAPPRAPLIPTPPPEPTPTKTEASSKPKRTPRPKRDPKAPRRPRGRPPTDHEALARRIADVQREHPDWGRTRLLRHFRDVEAETGEKAPGDRLIAKILRSFKLNQPPHGAPVFGEALDLLISDLALRNPTWGSPRMAAAINERAAETGEKAPSASTVLLRMRALGLAQPAKRARK